MKITKRVVATFLLLALLIGVIPTTNVQAATDFDENAGYFYLAKGETITVNNKTYDGKMSVVSNGGNTVKISGRKLIVTGKKSGLIVFKAGKKKIAFRLCVGGNNKDSKVNYSEYDLKFTDGKKEYKNYIDCMRYRIKKNKDIIYIVWDDKKDNKEIKTVNRGVYIGQSIYEVNKKYPSWCDYGGWTADNGDVYQCVQCALYYDKTSDCVFYKLFYGLEETDKISGVEWGCWKNKSMVYDI